MTVRNHFRALLRFIGPWSDQGEACMLVFGVTAIFTAIIASIGGEWRTPEAVLLVLFWAMAINTLWRFAICVLPASFSKRLRRMIASEWHRAGKDPLLYSYILYRKDFRDSLSYFCEVGFSKKKARTSALRNAQMRRPSINRQCEPHPWRVDR